MARGVTVAGMILVNDQGDPARAFGWVRHAQWHGWTPADLVFPAFLVLVGASLAFPLGRHEGTGGDAPLHRSLLRRAGTLVGLGLLLNLVTKGDEPLRVLGVMQRIGLTYLLAALVIVHLTRRAQVALAAGVLGVWWAALRFVPVPAAGGPSLSPDANLPGAVDGWLLGPEHLYSPASDPESLVGTIPATVSVLLGYWAMRWLRERTGTTAGSAGLAVAGSAALATGMMWDAVLPVNKQLWTSSFVLVSGGAAVLLLAAAHQLVDVAPRGRPSLPDAASAPWRILGRNALVAYLGSELVGAAMRSLSLGERPLRGLVTGELLTPWLGGALGSMAYGLAMVGLWWAVCRALDRRGIYVTA